MFECTYPVGVCDHTFCLPNKIDPSVHEVPSRYFPCYLAFDQYSPAAKRPRYYCGLWGCVKYVDLAIATEPSA